MINNNTERYFPVQTVINNQLSFIHISLDFKMYIIFHSKYLQYVCKYKYFFDDLCTKNMASVEYRSIMKKINFLSYSR